MRFPKSLKSLGIGAIVFGLLISSKAVLANSSSYSPAAGSTLSFGSVNNVGDFVDLEVQLTHSGVNCTGQQQDETPFTVNLTDPLPEPFMALPSSGAMPQGNNKKLTFTIRCLKSATVSNGSHSETLTITSNNSTSDCGGPYTHASVTYTLSCSIGGDPPSPTPTPTATPAATPTPTPAGSPTPVPTPSPGSEVIENLIPSNVIFAFDKSDYQNRVDITDCRIGVGTFPPIAQDGVTVTGPFTTNPCGGPNPVGGCLFDPDDQGIDHIRSVLTGDDGALDDAVCDSDARMAMVASEDGLIDEFWDLARWGVMAFSADFNPPMAGLGDSKNNIEGRFFDFDNDGDNDEPRNSAWTLEVFKRAINYYRYDPTSTGDAANLLFHAPDPNDPGNGGCRNSYLILVSSDKPNNGHKPLSQTGGNPDYNDNPVLDLYKLGLTISNASEGNNPNGHVITYAIAFSADSDNVDIMNEVADCGDDGICLNNTASALTPNNPEELKTALTNVLNEIISGSFTRAKPILAKTTVFGQVSDVIIAHTNAVDGQLQMEGHVRVFARDANGAPFLLDATTQGGAPATATEAGGYKWDVANRVPTSRTIKILSDLGTTTLKNLATANTDLTATFYGLTDASNFLHDVDFDVDVDQTDADLLTNFIGWQGTQPTLAGSAESRNTASGTNRVGGVYHSTPKYVGAPNDTDLLGEPGYTIYVANQASRTPMLYYAANDCMVHAAQYNYEAVNAVGYTQGVEQWSWIPNAMVPNLKEQRLGGNRICVDGPLAARDVYIKVGGSFAWRTILVGGFREGGVGYYALDVTNPNSPQVLWQFTDNDLGNTYAEPNIFKVAADIDGLGSHWVVSFAGGQGKDSLFLLNASTGAIVKEWNGIHDTLMGDAQTTPVTPDPPSPPASPNKSLIGQAAVIDYSGDGNVESIYFGSMEGFMIKANVSNANKANWSFCLFYDPADADADGVLDAAFPQPRQPITFSPTSAFISTDHTKSRIIFGTGDEDNILPTQLHHLHAVDDLTIPGCSRGIQVTGTNFPLHFDAVGSPQGEIMTGEPVIAGGVVFFSTFQPGSGLSQPCGIGESFLNAIVLGTGAAFDLDNTTAGTQSKISIGSGIGPAPVLDLEKGQVIVITSENVLPRLGTPEPINFGLGPPIPKSVYLVE